MTIENPTTRLAGSEHEKGVLLIVAATLAWSASGVYSRLLTTDVWTAIAWRSLFGGLFLLIPCLFLEGGISRRQWRSVLHPSGLAMIACQTFSQGCFIGALYVTTVANVTMIYATTPFIAALFGWLILRERVAGRTLIAGAISLIGVAVIVASSIGGGTGWGDLLALGMTASFALVIIIPRISPGVPSLPPTVVSAFLTLVIFAPFGSAGSLDLHNWIVLAAFGATNFSLALVLFLAGAKRMPPAEAALIGTMEIVLTPFWVWLLFSEEPPVATYFGGAIILGAVLWHTAVDFNRGRRRLSAALPPAH
ncbi:DMT family transporter [Rhizobium lentis]|uniref:DMT family transporter n=1 Tax=Rhizobium lentis TaxID=1138194 RepID=UPI001A929308|nr:EamA family transporter [Rhizobium lentis]MBX4999492.1 EamA family transporter [Rhizobium lentis]MBX5015222.1 EamA family transporter [Rhizobium lentis]MBX5066821.1 EamA family transporter [Rhizobium lentis]MBX5078280.1 EamA family transporter [Rhizobium lentis]QSW97124.1 EamA family transporter [Rhizobium lentis]